MKITPPDGTVRPETAQEQQRKADGEFEQLLNDAVEKDKGISGPHTSGPVSRLTPTALISRDFEKGRLIQETEELLDQLDRYRDKLGHPNNEGKDLAPLIDQLQETRDRLLPRMDNLAEGDALKAILNELLILSSVEITRFTRGDYL